MTGIVYRPEIDGLRAVAVIPVILFHLGLTWIPGGFIGVDVFFVISGFLITSIIKKELDLGTFSFRTFWARRIRRILPAMILMTTVTLAVTYFFVFRPDQRRICFQALAGLLSIANFYYMWKTGDYWGSAAEESPFLHTWSLSVEEQFYLFFPIGIWIIHRIRPQWINSAILSTVFLSLLLFLWGCDSFPVATFYLLPTRIWELGTGCLLAVAMYDGRKTDATSDAYGVFASAGLCMIVASYLFITRPGGGLALGVVGATAIIAFGETGFCNKLLSHPMMVHIGSISYSLYLWHWPVLVLANQLGPTSSHIAAKLFLIATIYILALIAYHCVEKPTRRKSGFVPGILACGALVASVALGLAMFPRYYDTTAFERPSWNHYVFNLDPRETPEVVKYGVGRGIDIPDGSHSKTAFKEEGIVVSPTGSMPEVVVLGDSHGLMWSDAIRRVIGKRGIATCFFSMGAMSPFMKIPASQAQAPGRLSSSEKYDFDEARLKCLSTWKPKVVIISCYWNYCNAVDAEDLLDFLKTHAGRVLLLEDPPVLKIGESQNAMQVACYKGIVPAEGVKQYFPSQEGKGKDVIARLCRSHGCEVIRVRDIYANGEDALLLDGNKVVYVDNDHLTSYGASLAISRIENAIMNAMGYK